MASRPNTSMTYIASVESKVNIILKQKSPEGAIKDRPSATVDEFIHAISAFSDDPGVDPVDPKDEGTIVEDDDNKAAEEVAREERLRPHDSTPEQLIKKCILT